MTKCGRNLIIMGVSAIALTLILTVISIMIYHNSGDIYLDRSRPGYLPDEDEIEEEPLIEDYEFNKSGPVTPTVLEEYLDHLSAEVDALDAYGEAFPESTLNDDSLGIK